MLNSQLKKISKTLIQTSLVLVLGFTINLGMPELSKAEEKSKSVIDVIKEEIVEKVFGNAPQDSLAKGLVEEESENIASSEDKTDNKEKDGNVLKKVFEKLAVTPEDKEKKQTEEFSESDNAEESSVEKPATGNANKKEKEGLIEKAFNKLVNKDEDKKVAEPQSNQTDPETKEIVDNKEPIEKNEASLPKEEKSFIEKTIQTIISPLEDDKSKKAEVSTENSDNEAPPKMEEKSLIEKTIQTLVSPLEDDKEKNNSSNSKKDNKQLKKEKKKVVVKNEELKEKDKNKEKGKDKEEPGIIEKTIQALTPSSDTDKVKKEKTKGTEKKKNEVKKAVLKEKSKDKVHEKDKNKEKGKDKEEPGIIEKTIQALTPSSDTDKVKKEKALKKEKLNVATSKPENEISGNGKTEKNFIEKTIQNLISPLEDKKENQIAQQPTP